MSGTDVYPCNGGTSSYTEGQHGALKSNLNLKILGCGQVVLRAGRLSWEILEIAGA